MSVQLISARPPLDTIYTRIGLGPYQFICLFFVGCTYATESMMNVFSFEVSHSIQHEWSLSDTQVVLLSIARDVGVVLTGFGCSWLGDKYGRLPVVKWGLLGRFSGIMLGVVSLSFQWLLLGFFIAGLSLGFCRGAISTFSIEIMQPRLRGAILIGLLVFIISGFIGSTALAMYLIPMLKPTHWRVLLFLACVPELMSLLAANFFYVESPRYLTMVGEHEKAIKRFNHIAWINRKQDLSDAEKGLIRGQQKREYFSLGESLRRIVSQKYKPRLIYMMLLCLLTGYQLRGLLNNLSGNLEVFFDNPLMAVEISTLPIAVFIPLPCVEMPQIGRRWTLMGFIVIQMASSFLSSVAENQVLFVAGLLVLLFAVTFSFRILHPFTLELFDTSIRCYVFGLCFALFRLGGLLSRWQAVEVRSAGVPVFFCANVICAVAIWHYPFETALKPLDDFDKMRLEQVIP